MTESDEYDEEAIELSEAIMLLLQFLAERPDITEQFNDWKDNLEGRTYH